AEQSPDADCPPSERGPGPAQPRVPAEPLDPPQLLAAVASLSDDDEGDDDRKADADEPHDERHRRTCVRAVGVITVGPRDGRVRQRGHDAGARSERPRTAPRDHAREATRARRVVQLAEIFQASLRMPAALAARVRIAAATLLKRGVRMNGDAKSRKEWLAWSTRTPSVLATTGGSVSGSRAGGCRGLEDVSRARTSAPEA